ncbi:MAG: hypothetical protein JWO44_2610 [Bacteroidetes bacterium]|nr:hypothetical protein [Bacteroidota bacterium]
MTIPDIGVNTGLWKIFPILKYFQPAKTVPVIPVFFSFKFDQVMKNTGDSYGLKNPELLFS